MPKAFREADRRRIRRRLVDAGRSALLQSETCPATVEGLAREAGISKASLYRFFSSKEQLHQAVLKNETPASVKRLIEASFGKTSDTREALLLLMRAMQNEVMTDSLSRVLPWYQGQPRRLSSVSSPVKVLTHQSSS